MLRSSVSLVVLCLFCASLATAQDSATLLFTTPLPYKNLPHAKKYEFESAAQSNRYQEVKIHSARETIALKKTRESKYGMEIFFAETANSVSLNAFRREYDVCGGNAWL